jgi:hypothetical protein
MQGIGTTDIVKKHSVYRVYIHILVQILLYD